MTTLLTYQHVWTGKDLNGDDQYQYLCTWSDGAETWEFTLPWDDMEGVRELPMTSLRKLRKVEPVTLEAATDFFCALIAAPYQNKEACDG